MTSHQTYPLDMADDRQSARRQVTVSVRATGQTDRDAQQDQRQHIAGGQPLPPDASMMPSSATGGVTSSSGRRPSDLSSYAHAMLQHTKQQMDATNGSLPPAHLRVAGPAGVQRQDDGDNNGSHSHRHSRSGSQSQSPSRRSQHHHNHRSTNDYSGTSSRSSSILHGHRASMSNGTTALPNGI
ncbi:hypothetical protein SBRCBS47491_009270 [Sporothrix bragantina]|uniref:Uncharacterized protein n=1 Tax=Sporothrix bragantina TaxID=671064 RepID=A0ABP0CWG5_9PEZI